MLIASLAWLGLGIHAPLITDISEKSQIIPSAIQTCLGTTIFWLVATLLFGRIYCAVICPIGALQDLTIRLRKKTAGKPLTAIKRLQNSDIPFCWRMWHRSRWEFSLSDM